ncbi:hypothetical protein DXG01_010054 [Tephrocybe rancida]|nr:hypothetical protein DXG01_010054 [Tephrocybe rancida]
MATSQPIALPAPNSQDTTNMDYPMGSYNASHSGNFNPASYTRHFLGSPISWRATSFGARFPQGSPSAHLFSSLDHPKSSSIDEVSVMNAFNVFDHEGELCRNYNCCGIHLPDLHALLEHFEEVHVLVVDPTGPAQITVPFNPTPLQSQSAPLQPHQQPFDASDDMELELDLDNSTHPPSSLSSHSSPDSSSPPHTPNNPPLSHAQAHFAHQYGFSQHSAHSPYASPYPSQPPSPTSSQPQVHFPHASTQQPTLANPEEVFNAYARFSADYSSHMPGTQFNASGGEEIRAPAADYTYAPPQGIPPALLFASEPPAGGKLKLKVRGGAVMSNSTPTTPSSTGALTPFSSSSTSTLPSPAPSASSSSLLPTPLPSSSTSNSTTPNPSASSNHTPTHTPLPAPSLLLSKPFRCPKPNCNKSYKQANGLKYHMTHGSCNFAPPKDLEHVKDLLERKRRERELAGSPNGLSRSASLGSLGQRNGEGGSSSSSSALVNAQGEPLLHGLYGDLGCITETELREVEREAEKRVRPFACGVGDCQRRYKNMNGLRYHYQHSGDHGAVGLALLAGGLHECLGNNNNSGGSNGSASQGNNGAAGAGEGGKKPSHAHNHHTHAEEREGRRRGAPGGLRTVLRGGAASTPVSRATSVSRVGTPQPLALPAAPPLQKSASAYPAASSSAYPAASSSSLAGAVGTLGAGAGTGATTPFTPGYTNPQRVGGGVQRSSPPLTPLTAAVQGLGLGGSPPRSASAFSPVTAVPAPSQQQPQPAQTMQGQQQGGDQQQQLAYQAQFAELQRRQYLQMQQQQAQFQAQAQAQVTANAQQQQQQQAQYQTQFQSEPGYGAVGVMEDADARAQQEFVEAQEAQRREFEARWG